MIRSDASQPAPNQLVRPRIRRLLALTLVAITITAISVSCYAPVLRAFGRALIVNETVSRSDVVAVPQWTGASGVLEAADLISEGLASSVAVLKDSPTAAELELQRRGVPDYPRVLVNLL